MLPSSGPSLACLGALNCTEKLWGPCARTGPESRRSVSRGSGWEAFRCHARQSNRIQALCFGYFHLGLQMKVTAGRAAPAGSLATSQTSTEADSHPCTRGRGQRFTGGLGSLRESPRESFESLARCACRTATPTRKAARFAARSARPAKRSIGAGCELVRAVGVMPASWSRCSLARAASIGAATAHS